MSKEQLAAITRRNNLIKELLAGDYAKFSSFFDDETLRSHYATWNVPTFRKRGTFTEFVYQKAVAAEFITAPSHSSARTPTTTGTAAYYAAHPDRIHAAFLEHTTPLNNGCHRWTGTYATHTRRTAATARLVPRFGLAKFLTPPTTDARRYIYEYTHGPLAPYTHLTTTARCDPLCVNPRHIFIRGSVPEEIPTEH